MRPLTIVMYHYVRDLANSRFPQIKGLDTALFKAQIEYLSRHYNFVSAYDVMAAVKSGDELPERSVLLTFDDAYRDHYATVFPVLQKAGISGAFFAPVKCITENAILDVNKLHFVLASVPDIMMLVDVVGRSVEAARDRFELASVASYRERLAKTGRYDSADVIYVKRMLQRELPETLRGEIVDALFRTHVSGDEKAFSRELYMNTEEMTHLQDSGMYVGAHGNDHYWLSSLNREQQAAEIDASLDFLQRIGSPTDDWVMCYPYGAYDDTTLELLRDRGCSFGLATTVGIADLDRDDPLTLPRLDTNDLPKAADAARNDWTQKVFA